MPEEYQPYLIAINLTQQCNLSCDHCYMDAVTRGKAGEQELTTMELIRLFDEITKRAPGTLIVLTGGEPLLRKDIEILISEGSSKNLRMVLGSNGILFKPGMGRRLKDAGLEGVGISLDDVRPLFHNRFRGVSGAWEKTVSGIQECRSADLHVQLHTTVTRQNVDHLRGFVDFALEHDIAILNFFFLVCTGRGKWVDDISAEQYESALKEIACLQAQTSNLMIQSRCAPHFKRVLYQQNPNSPYTRSQGYDGGGCPAATHYCRIDPVGNVTPCPYMQNRGGNIRETSFWEIWDQSSLFQSLRKPVLKGRCAQCEYQTLCGGCRARAQNQYDDLMAEDPSCNWESQSQEVIPIEIPDMRANVTAKWTPEAKKRLENIPLFLRGMIRKRLEEKAIREGMVITPEMMSEYREQRERELGIKFKKT